MQVAGERAIAHSALVEAARHYTAALELLTGQPESPDRDRRELGLQLAVGPAFIAARGWASPEVERAYSRARELCAQLGDSSGIFQSLFGLWVNHLVRLECQAANKVAEELLQRALRANDKMQLLFAHQALGDISCEMGKFLLAREHLEKALSLCTQDRQQALGVDMQVVCLSYLATTLSHLGYADQALKRRRVVKRWS